MGMAAFDKSVYTAFSFAGAHIDWRTLSLIYRYDWLGRKICDRPALDAVRRWITCNDDRIKTELERLNAKARFKQAIAWARLYGGAAILLIVDDGKKPSDPLEPSKVRRVIDLKVVDRHHLAAGAKQIEDPYAIRYGEPELYATNNGTLFHHTRVLKFIGADLTQDEAEREQYWGGSFIELYQDAVKAFQGSIQDSRHILTESSLGVLKIPNLTQAIVAGGQIWDAIQSRLDKFNLSKSLYRTAAMDSEEEYDYKNRTLTGIDGLLDRFATQVSGASDMPQLVLFGTTPAGLNSSQSEQLVVYYDMVRSMQEGDMAMAISTVMACMNEGIVPEWDYAPLMEPSDMDEAKIRNTEAQAIAQILPYVALSPEEIVSHLNGTGHFDLPTNGLVPGMGRGEIDPNLI